MQHTGLLPLSDFDSAEAFAYLNGLIFRSGKIPVQPCNAGLLPGQRMFDDCDPLSKLVDIPQSRCQNPMQLNSLQRAVFELFISNSANENLSITEIK